MCPVNLWQIIMRRLPGLLPCKLMLTVSCKFASPHFNLFIWQGKLLLSASNGLNVQFVQVLGGGVREFLASCCGFCCFCFLSHHPRKSSQEPSLKIRRIYYSWKFIDKSLRIKFCTLSSALAWKCLHRFSNTQGRSWVWVEEAGESWGELGRSLERC